MERPLFAVRNHHHESCGRAPYIQDINKNEYLAYYENEHGEQWVFIYNRVANIAQIYCGDAGWNQPYPVKYGICADLVMSEHEKQWLAVCYATATVNR